MQRRPITAVWQLHWPTTARLTRLRQCWTSWKKRVGQPAIVTWFGLRSRPYRVNIRKQWRSTGRFFMKQKISSFSATPIWRLPSCVSAREICWKRFLFWNRLKMSSAGTTIFCSGPCWLIYTDKRRLISRSRRRDIIPRRRIFLTL